MKLAQRINIVLYKYTTKKNRAGNQMKNITSWSSKSTTSGKEITKSEEYAI